MEKILFINACVRENSRTLELARCILDKLNGEMGEINLEQENLDIDGNDATELIDKAKNRIDTVGWE